MAVEGAMTIVSLEYAESAECSICVCWRCFDDRLAAISRSARMDSLPGQRIEIHVSLTVTHTGPTLVRILRTMDFGTLVLSTALHAHAERGQ